MIFIGKFLINQLLKRDESSMDFGHIEKRLFACIVLVSFLVALIISFVNSLLLLSNLYFLNFGFSEKQSVLINIAIVGSLIAVTAFGTGACLRGVFQKRKSSLPLDEMPKVITSCISEFMKGYKEF